MIDLRGAARRAAPAIDLRGSARRAAPAIGLYLGLRMLSIDVLTLLSVYGHRADPNRQVFWDGSTNQWLGFTGPLDALLAWDGRWYVLLATSGQGGPIGAVDEHGIPYSHRVPFLPLYPMVARALSALPLVSPTAACLIVSLLCSVAAAWAMYAIGEHLHSRRFGILFAALWAVMPMCLAENGAFTEPMFTAFAGWALYSVITRRWLVAGLLTLLAGLSRPSAAALIATVGLAAIVAAVRRQDGWRPYAAMVMAPAGYLGYVAYATNLLGGGTAYYDLQRTNWDAYFDWGRSTAIAVWNIMIGHGDDATVAMRIFAVFFLFGMILLTVLAGVRRHNWVLVLYAAMMIALAAGSHAHLSMLPRHLLPAFPVLLVPAAAMAKANRVAVGVVLVALGLFSGWYGCWMPFISGQAL